MSFFHGFRYFWPCVRTGYVNVDNLEEFDRIVRVCRSLGRTRQRIGIRLSPEGAQHYNKFGFSIGKDATAALTKMAEATEVQLVGLHTHRSSIPTLGEYRDHIAEAMQFASTIARQGLIQLEYVDVGSGFTVKYPEPLSIDTWTVPTMNQYGKVLAEIWRESSLPKCTYMIIEPGKRMVASCVSLLTTVVSVKDRPNGKICFVDAGHNLMPGVDWCRHPISQVNPRNSLLNKETYDIHGCLCDGLDILRRDVSLFPLVPDEVLCISNVGGYDMSRSFVWQIPRAPVVWVRSNSDYELVREKEGVDCLWQLCR